VPHTPSASRAAPSASSLSRDAPAGRWSQVSCRCAVARGKGAPSCDVAGACTRPPPRTTAPVLLRHRQPDAPPDHPLLPLHNKISLPPLFSLSPSLRSRDSLQLGCKVIPFLCFLLRLCFVAKIPLSVVCSLPWPHGGNSSLVLLVSLCSYVLLLGYRHACTLGFEGVLLIPTADSRVLRFLPSAKQLLFGSLRSVLLSCPVLFVVYHPRLMLLVTECCMNSVGLRPILLEFSTALRSGFGLLS
jgi:hypothetical protein